MRKWNRMLLACAGCFFFAMAAWLVFHHSAEPSYKGKSLGFWLQKYISNGQSGFVSSGIPFSPPADFKKEPDEAMRAMGTNAVPFLVNMLQSDDSGLKRKIIELSRKQRRLKISLSTSDEKHLMAECGIKALGNTASNAVPAMIRMLDKFSPENSRKSGVNSADRRFTIIHLLGAIGPPATNAVPALMRIAANKDDLAAHSALSALASIHADPDLVIPLLVEQFHRKDSSADRAFAIRTLGNYGTNSKVPISGIFLAIKMERDGMLRNDALRAISKIYGKPEWKKYFFLLNASGGVKFPVGLVNDLGDMGRDAAAVVPALETLLQDEDADVRASATNALRKIDPEAAVKAGVR